MLLGNKLERSKNTYLWKYYPLSSLQLRYDGTLFHQFRLFHGIFLLICFFLGCFIFPIHSVLKNPSSLHYIYFVYHLFIAGNL